MKLQVVNVNKNYKKLQVLKGINLVFEKGIYGLVGPNGAGKSTLMRLLVGAEKTTSGEILYENEPIEKQLKKYKKALGYLPQEFGFYKEFTGREMLRYTGLIKTELTLDQINEQADAMLKMLDLQEKADTYIGKYSGGMKQRLGIAQAFLGEPEIVILDEATVGLDPMQRIKFKTFLKEYSRDKIVILSTHIMSDLQEIADNLIFLKEGKIVYENKIEKDHNLDSLYMKYFNQMEN